MNRIQNILLGSALLLTALAACSDHNEADTTLPDTDHQAVMLSVNIEGDAAPTDATRAATRGMQAATRAGDAGDIAYTPAADEPLCLFYGNVTGNHIDSDQAATYHYDAATAKWQAPADGAPLYWDNLTAASITDGQTGRLYSFYALANTGMLKGDATGGDLEDKQATAGQTASDLMMAYTYTERRTTTAPIAFTLKHLMAQLTITLKNDPDATGDARFTNLQLEGATATAKLLSEYTLAYSPISSKADADKATAVPATAKAKAGALKDFTLLSTVHYAKNADGSDNTAEVDHISFTCIAPPQALTGAVIITIDGRNYTFTPAADAITLAAGVNTVQPLTAKKTGLTPGEVTVTDWGTDTKASADLTADGIYPGSESLTGIKEAGILSLYAYKPGEDGTLATYGTYPVTYDANSANENKATISTDAATGYSPILWDNLTKYAVDGTLQKYAYAATYVPDGYILTGKTTSDANTELHEKDLLGSISVATPWGTAPDFVDTDGNGISNADTRLKHLMARFIVKLTCTDGTYTAAELNAAKLTTVRKMIADPAAPLTVSNAGVTLNTADAPSSSDPDANKVTLVMTVAATTNTGADTDNIAQYSAILAPQTLTADDDIDQTVLRLSISGAAGTKEYILKKAITLEAGKNNVLTATLTQTELKIGKITVAPWDDSTKGDGNFEM